MNAPGDLVGRVGSLLRAISGHPSGGATTSDLARATGLPRPTAHRLLGSLAEQGLVDRDPRGRWLLGPELYLLGAAASARYDITDVALPHLNALTDSTGESAFLTARRGDETVCLLRQEGSFPIRSHVLHEGIRFPLGVASAGLALLAYLPDEEIAGYLGRTDLTPAHGPEHSPENLWARIRATRATGYAVNPGLLVEGSWGMGAVVFDRTDQPRWALSLTGIEQRFTPERRAVMGEQLLRSAHALTSALRPPRPL